MPPDQEILQCLIQHLSSIMENNVEGYHLTTSQDLTLYEWWITPHRIDGLPFHDFMMNENARLGTVFGSEADAQTQTRFDLSNLKIQRYGDTAIATYTILLSSGTENGVTVSSHNETRVLTKIDGNWKVVHVHKSPAWQTPHNPPAPQ